MNLNTLNIKYFATTFLLVFICVMNNLNAQNTLNRDKIEIIIGSYKNENNAYLHKIKLKKKGFKGVRVLPKKNKFFKVSINQFKTLKETNQFIDSVGIKKIDYWLFYQEDYKASIEIVTNKIDSLNVKTTTIPVEEIIQTQVKDSIIIFIKENENKVSSNSKTHKETSVDLESSIDLIETFNDNLDISEHLDSINSIYLKTQSIDTIIQLEIDGNEIDSLKVKTVSIPVEEIKQTQVKDSITIFIKENKNKFSSSSKTDKETSVDIEPSIDLIETSYDNLNILESLDSIDSIFLKTQSIDTIIQPGFEVKVLDSIFSFDVFQLENKIAVDIPAAEVPSVFFDESRIDSLSNLVDLKKKTNVNNIFSAKSNYEAYEFSPAIERYLKLARSGKGNKEIFENLAIAYYNNSQYDLATVWFNKLISSYPKNLDPKIYFKASVAFKSIEAYDAADQFYKKYVELNKQPISQKYFESNSNYLDTILKNSLNYNLFKTNINTQNSDFGLSFYDNDKVVFASSLDATGNKKFKWSNEPFLDLFTAQIDSLGNLSEREQLKGNVNTKYHESTATISKDGNTMYFTRNNFYKGRLKASRDKEVKLKIYKATKNQDSWDSIEELPFNGNQYSTAHPILSPDEKKLYFSSDMPGTFGMSDIWFVYIFDDGVFSQPINLGPNVNTEFRESFPFIDSENNFYFSSDGKLGLGGFDVFEAKLNERGYPYKISNVGKPVNSAFDDFGYVYNNNRKFGFISSNRNGLNGSSSDEVYKIVKTDNFSQSIKSSSQCEGSIRGIVFDKYTKKILIGATIELLNKNNNIIKEIDSNNLGEFVFNENIDCSESYLIRVSNGISYNSRTLILDLKQDQNIFENIDLEWSTNCLPDDLICVLGIEPIYFDLNKASLTGSSILSLNKVIIAMTKYPKMILQISSYADSRASIQYNKDLSLRRAIKTKRWLTSKGVNSSRLIIKALGEENIDNICLDNPDCSEAEYQLNRKSTFKILHF